MSYKTIVEEDIDILVCGAGLGGTGAAFEARFWGQGKKIVIAEKANIDTAESQRFTGGCAGQTATVWRHSPFGENFLFGH